MRRSDEAIDWVVGGGEARAAAAARLLVDPAFAAEVAALERALSPLSAQGPDLTPPPELWDRLEAALDAEVTTLAGTTTQHVEDGAWQDVSPGVSRKWLWGDRTFLMRVAPGASILDHDHPQHTEHCLVIQGSIMIGGLALGPGDYHAAPLGTRHARIHSVEGGLMLIRRGD